MIYFTMTRKNILDNNLKGKTFKCKFKVLEVINAAKTKKYKGIPKPYVQYLIQFTECDRFGENWDDVVCYFDAPEELSTLIGLRDFGDEFYFEMRVLTSGGKDIPYYLSSEWINDNTSKKKKDLKSAKETAASEEIDEFAALNEQLDIIDMEV